MKPAKPIDPFSHEAYLAAEAERAKTQCTDCCGFGDIAEGGMFSRRYRCPVCNGSGLKKPKRRAKRP